MASDAEFYDMIFWTEQGYDYENGMPIILDEELV
jgi:hypothetical protein